MRRFLLHRLAARLEEFLGVELPYLRAVVDHAPGAFVPIALAMPASGYGRRVPAPVLHMARLGATRAQDCAECLQIAVNVAVRDGVDPEHVLAAVSGRTSDLPAEYAEAFDFGTCVGSGDDPGRSRAALQSRFTERGLIEVSMAAAASHFFPALKRGMGFARACDVGALAVPSGAHSDAGR